MRGASARFMRMMGCGGREWISGRSGGKKREEELGLAKKERKVWARRGGYLYLLPAGEVAKIRSLPGVWKSAGFPLGLIEERF